MNFGQLKSMLLEQIGRAPADLCYALTTADINNRLRTLDMEATATLVEAESVALPSDFIEVVSLYRDTTPRTELRPASSFSANHWRSGAGTPTEYVVTADALLLGPGATGGDLVLRYIASLPDLSDDSDTNAVLTKHPSVYVYGVLAHHGLMTADEAATQWAQLFQSALLQARFSDERRYGRAPTEIRVGHSTP